MDLWQYLDFPPETPEPDGGRHTLVEMINDLALEGWEVVTFVPNAEGALLRRKIVPLPPPEDEGYGWKPDPSGRADLRHWSGTSWTYEVRRYTDQPPGPDGERIFEESRDWPSVLDCDYLE